jgi:hypothetical protein
MACRFLPLIHVGGQLELSQQGGRALVRWRAPANAMVHSGYVELLFGVAVEGIRRETGRSVTPRRTWFCHPPPDDLTLHRRVLGDNVCFDMPEALFELDSATAHMRLLRANAATRASAAAAAEDAMQRLGASPDNEQNAEPNAKQNAAPEPPQRRDAVELGAHRLTALRSGS